ncbi:group I truncated hemoglobin [Cyclobacterium plantarum]|uniref:Group 1 truncated hemoglobin n=1 Tax=Cyclobacterium plantarum TaxID=2716263 RepID=A0ABX0HFQ6_9BACT|nr:group 1 truncated hemoglobin [Cyclobacterium plantarum]NHE59216.1 group 1 truncated hemoglobin [Cyclobacterium plantarum]
MNTVAQKTLFERLGGKKGITSLVDDIVEAHMQNPVIQVRFLPYKEDPENLKKIKGHLVDFFSAGSGGNVAYLGRDMETTHRGMNINEEEYMAATDDIMNTLEKHGIDEESQKDVLAIAYSLKEQIMKQ